MGYIEIPKIKIFLPIYEGCSKSNLDLGVGHIENTSMPIGGIGTHCVLAGHTGIRRTKIFDDIHELRNGDNFFINILNLKLEYEVDNIKVVGKLGRFRFPNLFLLLHFLSIPAYFAFRYIQYFC